MAIAVVLLGAWVGTAFAHELISSPDFNWKNSGSYAACGKTGVGDPNYRSGKGRSWLTSTSGDCDATKVSAYLQTSILVQAKVSGTWYWCVNWDMATWQTTTVHVADVSGSDCSSNGTQWRTLSSHGACVSGSCWQSGDSVNEDPDVCPRESGTYPPPSGYVYTNCVTLELYPTTSPAHGSTHPG